MTLQPDGRDTRWETHRQERRGTVLATAVRLVDASGKVDLATLSAATPIPRSTLYRLFDDRPDLDEQIRQAIVADLVSHVGLEIEPDDSVRSFVARGLVRYIAWVARHPHLQRFMTGGADVGTPDSGAVRRGRQVFVDLFASTLATSLSATEGEDPVIRRAAHGITGLVEGVVVGHELADSDEFGGADDLAAFLTEAVCALVMTTATLLGIEIDLDRPLAPS